MTTMTETTQKDRIIDSQRRRLEAYESKIETLESQIDSLIAELNDSERNFIELRKAYKALKKSIEK